MLENHSAPLAHVAPLSPWVGGTSLGLFFGGQNIARAPRAPDAKPAPSLQYTVIPLPVMPSNDVTMPARADAISASFSGRLQSAVDLYRSTVEQNGFMVGILSTMAHGLLGLPLSWQGDDEMVSALSDQDGTSGDFSRMCPEAECAKIFSDAMGLGFGWGQLLLMCWVCDGVDFARSPGATTAHAEVQTCMTCAARLHERPLGMRKLFQLRWRDARWFWREPVSGQWFFNGRQKQVAVRPGDGEWVLIKTVPDLDVWNHGPWKLGTEAAIFARDSRYDRLNTSRACAPTRVYKATGPTDPKTRADVEAQSDGVKFGNSLILPGEWEYSIESAEGTYSDVTGSIVDDVDSLWEVCLTGNRMGTESGTGFANMDIYARATRERRRFYAGAWIRQIRAQALVWWALENFGTRNAPVGSYDTRSPEDKLAAAEADEKDGKAVAALQEGYGQAGFELEPQYLVERAQQRGIRIRLKAGGTAVAKLPLGVDAVSAVVRGGVALANLGLPPFGDERDDLTIAELAARGAGGAPPEPQGPPAPAEIGARLALDESEEPTESYAAKLAARLTELGYERCRHTNPNTCRLCGVRREDEPDPLAPNGFRIVWQPRVVPARARLERATQQREGDGKFGGSDGASAKPVAKEKAPKAPTKETPASTATKQVLEHGVKDADLHYERSGMRDLEPFHRAFEAAKAKGVSADELAASGDFFGDGKKRPVEINVYPDGKTVLNDGRHRYTAAREAGAKHVLAKVTQYGPRGGVHGTKTAVVKLSGRLSETVRATQQREGDGKFGGSDGTGHKPAGKDKAPAKEKGTKPAQGTEKSAPAKDSPVAPLYKDAKSVPKGETAFPDAATTESLAKDGVVRI